MGRSLSKLEADQADVVIRPDVARIASTDFNARGAFIQIGLAAGTRFVPVIHERIANGRNSRRRS
jgi:predicted acylesterase/phospholipase RssA